MYTKGDKITMGLFSRLSSAWRKLTLTLQGTPCMSVIVIVLVISVVVWFDVVVGTVASVVCVGLIFNLVINNFIVPSEMSSKR